MHFYLRWCFSKFSSVFLALSALPDSHFFSFLIDTHMKKIRAMSVIATIERAIHIGERTHHHDHCITSVNFSATNSTVNIGIKLGPVLTIFTLSLTGHSLLKTALNKIINHFYFFVQKTIFAHLH